MSMFSGSRAWAAGSDDQLSTEVDHGRGRGDDGTPEHVATQPARTGATNEGDELAAVRHQQHQETTDDPPAEETTHGRYGSVELQRLSRAVENPRGSCNAALTASL